MSPLVLANRTSDLFGNSTLMCDVVRHPKIQHLLRAVRPSVVLASGTWHHLTHRSVKPNCATVSRSVANPAALLLREHDSVVAM